MSFIETFLEDAKGKAIEEILLQPDLPEVIQKISSELNHVSSDQKKAVEDIMKGVLSLVDQEIEKLEGEMISNRKAVEHVQKNTEACLAYLGAVDKGKQNES